MNAFPDPSQSFFTFVAKKIICEKKNQALRPPSLERMNLFCNVHEFGLHIAGIFERKCVSDLASMTMLNFVEFHDVIPCKSGQNGQLMIVQIQESSKRGSAVFVRDQFVRI